MSCRVANRMGLCLAGILLAAASAALGGNVIYVDADAPCGSGGLCWPDAYKYLQDALAEASAAQKPVEIRVAGYAGSGGADPNTRDLVAYETILSGDLDANDVELAGWDWGSIDDFIRSGSRQENSYTVVMGSGTDGTAVLDGFTITGGHASGPILGECPDVDYRYRAGGGMYNDSGSPAVVRCTFRWNVAESFYGWTHGGTGCCCTGDYPGVSFLPGTCGGGVCNRDSSPTLDECNFEENIAYGADDFSAGGGMFNINSNPRLINCVFTHNAATGFDNEYHGGGMYNDRSGVVLTNCSFIGNTTIYGGGGGMENVDNSDSTLTRCRFEGNPTGGMNIEQSSPTLTDCTFVGNQRSGLSIGSYSKAVLTGCTFIGNSTLDHGGGVTVWSNAEPTLTNCSFVGNSAGYGGAISNHLKGEATVIGCTFFGNSAWYGGAVYNSGSGPTMVNCVFSGNRTTGTPDVGRGGGMFNDGSDPVLTNCTFAGNWAPNGSALACWSYWKKDPSIVRATNCIFRDGGDEVWNDDGSAVVITYSNVEGGFTGAGNIDGDPLFADADGVDDVVGTEDDDLQPVAGSPCIDAGDNSAVPAWIETDIAGRVRIMSDTVDMGVHESQAQVYVDTVKGDDLNDGLTPGTAFATIQKGINSAAAGYSVLVYPGVYAESIDFLGKAITVRGAEDAPVLESPGDYGASFYSLEGPNSVLKNFVIRNSFVGVFTAGASPTIKNVTVVGNEFGAAAYAGVQPDIVNCIFWDNIDGDLYGCTARYSWVQEDIASQPTDGLICHWEFEEGGGNYAYDSAYENDLWLMWPEWTTGVIGGALDFDGTDYGEGEHHSIQLIHTNQITVSVWIKLNKDVGNGEARIISKQLDQENSWALTVYGEGYSGSTGNQIVFHDSDGSSLWYDCMSATNLSPNQWHHVCVTDSGGSIRIYVNGGLDWSSDDGYGIPSEILSPIRVGWINYGSHFNGLMDDLRVYNRALGAEEITDLHQNGLWGYGSLADPLFADPANGDYHLRSERGRYWPEHDLWVLDSVSSPCVDSGDPNDGASSERTPNGGRINIGAFGGTAYASMSECWSRADYNCDGVVNMLDFADVADKWLQAAEWFE